MESNREDESEEHWFPHIFVLISYVYCSILKKKQYKDRPLGVMSGLTPLSTPEHVSMLPKDCSLILEFGVNLTVQPSVLC